MLINGRIFSIVLLACAACGGSDDEVICAPAGTYVGAAVRSADPGDCPSTLTIEDIGWKLETVTVADKQACGSQQSELSGSGSDGCSHTGTADLYSTSTGVTGKASFHVNCSPLGAADCTANFDLVFTRQ